MSGRSPDGSSKNSRHVRLPARVDVGRLHRRLRRARSRRSRGSRRAARRRAGTASSCASRRRAARRASPATPRGGAARYSSSRSGRTRRRKQTRSTQPTSAYSRPRSRGDAAHVGGDVADPERDVVGRALGAPALEELGGRATEAQPAVRVADPERRPRDRLALGGEQLEPPVGGLRAPDDGDRPVADLELDAQPGPGLAVVELERAQRRLLLRDREVAGPVVAHEHEAVVEVERVELGVGPARAEPVEHELRDVRLEVGLAGRRDPARGEQRVADDHAGAEALGLVAADAAVVVGQRVELEVGDEPVEARGDARRPVELLGLDRPGDRVGGGVREREHRADLVLLRGRLVIADLLHARAEVVDLEHLDVRAELRVDHGEVGVHVEHPGIDVPEEADPRRAERARHAGGADPGADLRPRALVVVDRPRDGVVGDPRARERAGDLRHAAGGAVGQPLAGVHVRVVERGGRLEPEEDDGRLGGLHDGEHRARRRVRHGMAEDEVDLRAARSGRPPRARPARCRRARRRRPRRRAPPRVPRRAAGSPRCARAGPRTAASTCRGRSRTPRPGRVARAGAVSGRTADRRRSSTNQKSKSSMLSLLNVVSGPRTISPLAPIVYSPSRPASNFSPSAPVMRPATSAAAACPAR